MRGNKLKECNLLEKMQLSVGIMRNVVSQLRFLGHITPLDLLIKYEYKSNSIDFKCQVNLC